MSERGYFHWSVTRLIRGVIKGLFLYPVMLVLLIPERLFTLCLFLRERLESWWWE